MYLTLSVHVDASRDADYAFDERAFGIDTDAICRAVALGLDGGFAVSEFFTIPQ